MRAIAKGLWSLAVLLAATAALGVEEVKLNPTLVTLQANTWVKLHEQKRGDAVWFRRQEHGGSCFDTKRGRLILFGSNTHGQSWINSPLLFDPVACAWTRLYPDDDLKTYAVNEAGLPVAGAKGQHPWTMHTFGAVVYDEARDEMVVCCHPGHLVPGQFTNVMKDLWPKIKRHPTWVFDLKTEAWRALPCEAVSFFPHSCAYDTDRHVILGYRPDGIHELAGEPRQWKRVATSKETFFGWHNNCAYDSKQKALVVFGSNQNSNDVVVYRPATGDYRKMPTPGERPPADQHNPMTFDPKAGMTVVVVDRVLERNPANNQPTKVQAETWLYDLGRDAWTRVPLATLPFGCGMNYNMEYDPRHGVHLLVTGGGSQPTAVWALRVDARRAASSQPIAVSR